MANNSINRGLDPEWAQGPTPETMRSPAFTTSGSLFANSAVSWTSGAVVAIGTTNTDIVTGSVKLIYDANKLPITNVATATAIQGCEFSTSGDQRFRVQLSAASTLSDAMGKLAHLTAETGTVGTSSYGSLVSNGTPSKRQLNQATLGTAQDPFLVIGVGNDEFAADITAANCVLYVKINPENFGAAN